MREKKEKHHGWSRAYHRVIRSLQERKISSIETTNNRNRCTQAISILSTEHKVKSPYHNSVASNSRYTRLPRPLLKEILNVVEETAKLASTLSKRNCTHSKLKPNRKRHAIIRTKTLSKFATMLVDEEKFVTNESHKVTTKITSFRKSMRVVTVRTAVDHFLLLWQALLLQLEYIQNMPIQQGSGDLSQSTSGSMELLDKTPNPTVDQILCLLQLLVMRREFDAVFLDLARGNCEVHGNRTNSENSSLVMVNVSTMNRTGSRRLSIQRSERHSSSVSSKCSNNMGEQVINRGRTSSQIAIPVQVDNLKKIRQVRKKKKQDTPTCDMAQSYVDLCEKTMDFLYNLQQIDNGNNSLLHHAEEELLATLLASNYIRIPIFRTFLLREMQDLLKALKFKMKKSKRSHKKNFFHDNLSNALKEIHSSTSHKDNIGTLPFWTRSLPVECFHNVTANCKEPSGKQYLSTFRRIFVNPSFQEQLFIKLIGFVRAHSNEIVPSTQHNDHVNLFSTNFIEWGDVPGSGTLIELMMTISVKTYRQFIQSGDIETVSFAKSTDEIEDKVENNLLKKSGDTCGHFNRDRMTAFTIEMFSVLNTPANQCLMKHLLLAYFHHTNYIVHNEVIRCLEMLELLVQVIPTYFNAYTDSPALHECHKLMVEVFTKLLESEHFEILKATQLFILRHFKSLSKKLQRLILDNVIEPQVSRLFLHWNRDVRYLFHHILLYLIFPGNRLLLCAGSDEILLGSYEAAHLFEVPRTLREAQCGDGTYDDGGWGRLEVFILDVINISKVMENNRQMINVEKIPAWVSVNPPGIIKRSIVEYQHAVQVYYVSATALPLHETVRVPVFTITT